MKWRKLGLVYAPAGDQAWARTHAYLPTPVVMKDRIRVYAAFWDDDKRGRLGYVDVSLEDPRHVISTSSKPLLDLGDAGAFDDSGVTPSCCLATAEGRVLYYLGWQRSTRIPYAVLTGLAIQQADGTFQRTSKVPLLERSDNELCIRSAAFVLHDGQQYTMWYAAGSDWTEVGGKPMPVYAIHQQTSRDPLSWKPQGELAIPLEEGEFGLARPWVLRDHAGWHMWFSVRRRDKPYALGYAHSEDGQLWTRKDAAAGLTASSNGWDSEMVCFPAVVDVGARRYMFYNGNGYGRTGFGVAELER